MSKTMELAKNFDNKKVNWPVYGQIKFDGVPVCYRKIGGHIIALTRQSEPVHSVDHIKEFLGPVMRDNEWVIAEHMVTGVPDFKNASGIIRRHKTDERIYGVIFDGTYGAFDVPYKDRYNRFAEIAYLANIRGNRCLRVPGNVEIRDKAHLMEIYTKVTLLYSQHDEILEGIMLHDRNKDFKPGRRGWGMQRYKPQPTIDVRVVGYDEAVSAFGDPLGRVGRIEIELRRQGRPPATVGVGPGKLTHAEAEALWRAYMAGDDKLSGIGSIAEVKFMPDPSYDALRQATFQRWRTDKNEPDVLEY